MGYLVFDKQKREAFLKNRKQGFSMQKICDFIGVSRSTVSYWLSNGKNDVDAGKKSEKASFYLDELSARRFEEVFLVSKIYKIIEKAMESGDLRTAFNASAWMLERKYTEDYSKTIQISSREDKIKEAFKEMTEDTLAYIAKKETGKSKKVKIKVKK